MAVQLLDLKRQYAYLKNDLEKAVNYVFTHNGYILGPEVKELEKKIADLCEVKHAFGVASGTDALLLALFTAGVKPGDEVITTDFSFFATAGVISRLGAKPVFVDIEEDTYNIDPKLIEAAITDKTKALIPVHLYGQIADMDAINEIAKKHNLIVIEDAAQAIGSIYKGKPAGSMGDFGCFSFYPTKNLGAAGDGGIVVTNNDEYAEILNISRNHGAQPKYYHKFIGVNSRLASIQAATLLVKLPYLKEWSQKRIEHAAYYNEKFKAVPQIKTPVTKEYSDFHIFNQYTIAVENREALMAKLKEAGIGFEIYYPVPFHKQECFADLGYKDDDLPLTNRAADEVLALPIYPELTKTEQDEVIEVISNFYA